MLAFRWCIIECIISIINDLSFGKYFDGFSPEAQVMMVINILFTICLVATCLTYRLKLSEKKYGIMAPMIVGVCKIFYMNIYMSFEVDFYLNEDRVTEVELIANQFKQAFAMNIVYFYSHCLLFVEVIESNNRKRIFQIIMQMLVGTLFMKSTYDSNSEETREDGTWLAMAIMVIFTVALGLGFHAYIVYNL